MPLEHDDLQPGCTHQNVVPSKWHEDGSIDGRCEDCGAKQEGFPIRDVGMERLARADAVELAEARGVEIVTREEFKDLVVEELACEVLGSVGERLPLEGETARFLAMFRDLDHRLSSDPFVKMRETTAKMEKTANAMDAAVLKLVGRLR